LKLSKLFNKEIMRMRHLKEGKNRRFLTSLFMEHLHLLRAVDLKRAENNIFTGMVEEDHLH
jgi:hypothetical protein